MEYTTLHPDLPDASCAGRHVPTALQTVRAWDRGWRALVLSAGRHGLLPYGALCRGLLIGRIPTVRTFEGDDLRNGDPNFQAPRFEQYLTTVGRLEQFARDHCHGV